MQLLKLKKVSDTDLRLSWSDNTETNVSLKRLRDECPCAGCKGETVLFESYVPVKLPVMTPGMFDLKRVEVIGNYSIQPTWGDGHNTGLYTFDLLHSISSPVE
jgi:DUF971 family protein